MFYILLDPFPTLKHISFMLRSVGILPNLKLTSEIFLIHLPFIMLLSLRNDHREHLKLLTHQAPEVVADFCKLCIDFLHNGPNLKLYATAAKKLSVEAEIVQNCVYGLVNLLLLSCKHKLGDADFRDSVFTIGFAKEQQVVLSKFYDSKQKELSELLQKLSVDDPHYHDLEWRFEVLVASRSLLHQAVPIVTMDLVLQTQGRDFEEGQKQHNILQTDPNNLLHLMQELESALLESRSSHSRRIQRAFLN